MSTALLVAITLLNLYLTKITPSLWKPFNAPSALQIQNNLNSLIRLTYTGFIVGVSLFSSYSNIGRNSIKKIGALYSSHWQWIERCHIVQQLHVRNEMCFSAVLSILNVCKILYPLKIDNHDADCDHLHKSYFFNLKIVLNGRKYFFPKNVFSWR